MKEKMIAKVTENKEISPGIYDMRLETRGLNASPGQFFMLYTGDGSRLLPRPISVCDCTDDILRLVYRVAGSGTSLFSRLKKDETLEIMGPLGNGYPPEPPENAVLIGGGIGLPPLLYLGKKLSACCSVTSILGYRNSDLFLKDEFDRISKVSVSTDDGSLGVHGTVMDVIKNDPSLIPQGSVLYACGPLPMLRAVREYALSEGLKCYLSLEERMACGLGVCLSCVCKTSSTDPHSNVDNARVCVDGPVFAADKVELN
ncbi:MAG: dihydroorotate dehydrogenase electron transfer subunit [Lachnospiraceae bacterium]|nr:dihydroorotate dehydrogenase electron transfer subunit [Lachnospiraceae bacterium]